MGKKLTEKELRIVDRSFDNFVKQFGKDIYTKIMFEVLLGELYGEPLSLLGESEQERPDSPNSNEGTMPTYEIE